MAIKDQCEKCKSYTSCSESKEFNGLSCPSYSKRIDLEKPQDNKASEKLEENKTEVVSTGVELPDPNQSIQGWLTFFLFSIGLGGIISAIFPIATYNVAEYDGSHFLALTDVALGIMLFALACYTIYSFAKRKPNAVFLGKMYVITVFATNVLSLIGGEFEETGLGSMAQVIRGLSGALSGSCTSLFQIKYKKSYQSRIVKSLIETTILSQLLFSLLCYLWDSVWVKLQRIVTKVRLNSLLLQNSRTMNIQMEE